MRRCLLPLVRPLALALLAGVIAACGGDRGAGPAPALQALPSAVAPPSLCDADSEPIARLQARGFRRQDQRCWRSSGVLDAPTGATPASADGRRRALAAVPTRTITVTELFDWAEVEYALYFPSKRSDQRLSPYTYRYYPESQNHVAVAEGKVYVQGPLSDGELRFVGALEDFTCRALPSLCVDAPAACNTADLSWSAGGNQCTPNPSDPLQIASGVTYSFSDSVQTTGQAAFRCDNGSLVPAGAATCNPAPPAACKPGAVEWTGSGGSCQADSLPTEVAEGASYTFTDSTPDRVGSATLRCSAGALQAVGTPVCAVPETQDSFGGDGGPADGSASGDGTAADGAPIVGGAVRVTDLNGRVATATTDSRGYFRVKLTGMQPPLLVRVSKDGRVRHSVSFQRLRTNGYIFIAVTGLTDKLASDLAGLANNETPLGAAGLTPARLAALGAGALAARVAELRNLPAVRTELLAAGLNPDTFDPLTTPFRADRTGYDRVLDNLAVDYENGATVLRSRICTITEISWTVGNSSCSSGSGSVLIRLNPGSTVTLQDAVGSTRGSATFTCELGLPRVQAGATCSTP